jgi:hypothetical protein
MNPIPDMGSAVDDYMTQLSVSQTPGGDPVAVDITQLSAAIYISRSPAKELADVFHPSNVIVGLKQCSEKNSSAGADPGTRTAVANALAGADGGGPQVSDTALIDAFFEAGRAAVVLLLKAQAQVSVQHAFDQSGVEAGTTALLTDMRNLVATNDIDLSDEAAVRALLGTTIGQDQGAQKVREYLIATPEALDVVVGIGLMPGLLLKSMRNISLDTQYPYPVRARARYALAMTVYNVLAHVVNAYDNVAINPECSRLLILQTKVVAPFGDSGPGGSRSAKVDEDIKMVLARGAQAAANVSSVATASGALSTRAAQASDLKVNSNADERDVWRARIQFFIWLAAYVAFVATSAFLISTDRVSIFLVLAAVVLVVPTIDLVVRAVFGRGDAWEGGVPV